MNSNWSYSPETKIWVVTSVTLTFDLWPWPFAWTLPWSNVITPENFMMIRWWEHSQKGVTDGQTDGQTDRRTENTIHRAAWSQLKTKQWHYYKWFLVKTAPLQKGLDWNGPTPERPQWKLAPTKTAPTGTASHLLWHTETASPKRPQPKRPQPKRPHSCWSFTEMAPHANMAFSNWNVKYDGVLTFPNRFDH